MSWKIKTKNWRPNSKWKTQFETDSEFDARRHFRTLVDKRTKGWTVLVAPDNVVVATEASRRKDR